MVGLVVPLKNKALQAERRLQQYYDTLVGSSLPFCSSAGVNANGAPADDRLSLMKDYIWGSYDDASSEYHDAISRLKNGVLVKWKAAADERRAQEMSVLTIALLLGRRLAGSEGECYAMSDSHVWNAD